MAEIPPITPTIPDKSTGSQVTATEFNNLKNKVVQLVNFVNGMFDNDHTLKTALLKDSTLSPDQFETLTDGKIGLIGFENIGSGGGLPKPEPPTVVVDTVTREISFTHDTYPNGLEYRTNSGAWGDYVAGTLINFGSGSVAANYYQARVKAVSGTSQASDMVGNNFISAVGGDTNLIDGYAYLDLSVLTGTAFPTPPLAATNNNWKITGDGFGQGQPGKRLAVGGHIAFLYQANSANTKMCVSYVAGSLGNYKAIEVEVTDAGVLKVSGPKITENENFPTQPTVGQFVDLTRVSGATSPSTFKVSILASDRTTVVYSKNYVVSDTPVADSAIEYDTAGGSAVINKPQGSGLTNI